MMSAGMKMAGYAVVVYCGHIGQGELGAMNTLTFLCTAPGCLAPIRDIWGGNDLSLELITCVGNRCQLM